MYENNGLCRIVKVHEVHVAAGNQDSKRKAAKTANSGVAEDRLGLLERLILLLPPISKVQSHRSIYLLESQASRP